jgi:CHAT domain-containing protein
VVVHNFISMRIMSMRNHGLFDETRWTVWRWLGFLPMILCLTASVVTTPGFWSNSRSAFAPSQVDEEIVNLSAGQVVVRRLASGQKHRYRVSLAADHVFCLVFKPAGQRLRVAIFDPDRRLVHVRSSHPFSSASFSWMAKSAGDYSIEIEMREGSEADLVYEFKLEAGRSAGSDDVARIDAERAMSEAEELLERKSENNNRQAIRKYNDALNLWRELGDQREVGIVLINIGSVYRDLGELKNAANYFNQALQRWQSLREAEGTSTDLEGLAESHFSLANVNYNLGNLPEARSSYAIALDLWQSLKSQKGQAKCLIPLAVLNVQLGERQQAIDLNRNALEIYRQMRNRAGEVHALTGLGYAYDELGDYWNAVDTHTQALRIAEEIKLHLSQQLLHARLGLSFLKLGHIQKALDHITSGLNLARQRGARDLIATSLRSLGEACEANGDRTKALELYEEALTILRDLQNLQEEPALLNDIGHIYELNGDKRRALSYYLKALPICRAVENRAEEIRTLHNIAHAQRDLGELAEARLQIEKAIEHIETFRAGVSSRQMRESYFATTQKSYSLYIDVLMQLHQRMPNKGLDRLALQNSEQARARVLREMLVEGQANLRRDAPAELFERERELEQLLSAKAEMLRLLPDAPGSKERAAALASEIRSLNLECDIVQSQIRKAAPGYAAITQPQALSSGEIQQQVLDGQTALLEYALGEDRSYLWLVTKNEVTSRELPAREKIEKEARRVYQLLTVRQPRRGESSDTYRERVNQARAEGVDERYWEVARALSQVILGPVASKMTQQRLLIVSDGALQYLSFNALPLPQAQSLPAAPRKRRGSNSKANHEDPSTGSTLTPLIIKYEIVSLPSATTLAVLRKEFSGRRPVPKKIAIVADPVFNQDDGRFDTEGNANSISPPQEILTARGTDKELDIPRLLSSIKEVELISRLVEPESRFIATGFKACRSLIESRELDDYRILHLSTHGTLDSEQPQLSSLVFSRYSPDRKKLDGFLRMHDIYKLRLKSDLIVLSACETGLGKEIKGEGLIALTRGFMYAGVPRVIASLWKVDDNATAELMQHFYRRLFQQRVSPGVALKEAQKDLWRKGSFRAPYFWAAFILQGEYRPLPENG